VLKSSRLPFALGALLLTTASAAANCAGLAADFDRAIASKNIEAVQNAIDAIANDIVCGEKVDDFRGKMIDFENDLAANPSTPAAERKKALDRASEPTKSFGTWREAKKLGDYYASVKDDGEAFEWYVRGISFLAARPSESANERDHYELSQRIAAALYPREAALRDH
jgi:hypothetical protein